MTRRSVLHVVTLLCGLMALLSATPVLLAQTTNLNCTIIVPDAPLTAAGLATPYQLVATDPTAASLSASSAIPKASIAKVEIRVAGSAKPLTESEL